MQHWKKVFAIIWTGQLFSTLSSSVVGYAVIFWLSIRTGSAEVLAYATIASLGPQMALGLFSGVFIDRWDRKRIMIAADAFIAICSAILAALFYFGEVEVGYIYILLALRSVGSAFHIPAMQASIPLLAPQSELMRVAGVNQAIQSVSVIAAPAAAALFVTTMDMTYILLVDVFGAAAAIVSLMLVTIPNPEKTNENPDILREVKEGLREIYSKAGLLWLFIFMTLATFFIMPVSALFPLMTLNHFSGDTFQMSFIEIAWGAGMLVGGAVMGIPRIKINKVVLLNAMYVILGLSFVLSGVLSPSGYPWFVALTTIGGISGAIYSGSFTVVVQTVVKPAALGRVFSIYGSLALAPSMVGLLATGFIADLIGIANAFIIAGVAIVLIGVVSFVTPAVAKMQKG